jgi:hypothetical protein
MEKTRIQQQYRFTLQLLLLWLSLFLFAPVAQAHDAHQQPHDGMQGARAAAGSLSASTLPCGGDGGSGCCCDKSCCVSPDLAKLPAVSQARFFVLPANEPRLPAIAGDHAAWTTHPLLAFSAPRAPPLPL